jgi:hypothetical protein
MLKVCIDCRYAEDNCFLIYKTCPMWYTPKTIVGEIPMKYGRPKKKRKKKTG